MAISEIEKLERRFAENPQGLTFAPLAEAYRKSGDPARALGILRPGLELHPDYIPASIVLGRCQLDLGSDAEAETAFARVLMLDPENVIALKALADIAERDSRFDDATMRLRALLDVDRSNEEAQAQLERVRAAKAILDATPRETVVDETPLIMESVSASFGSTVELEYEPAAEPPAVPAPDLEPEPVPVPMPPPPFDIASLEPSPLLADEPMFTDAPPVPEEVPVEPAADPIFGTLLSEEPPVLEELGVQSMGESESIVLEGRDEGEFQIPSASDDLGEDLVVSSENMAALYQLPDASSELIVLDSSTSTTEFQTPDASSSLLADLAREATDAPVELPEAEPVVEVVSEASSFAFFFASAEPPAEDDVEPETAEAPEDEFVGEWVTWSDAALDEDALPFEAPEPIAEPIVAAALETVTEPEPVTQPEPDPEVVRATAEPVPVAAPAEEPSVIEPEVEPDLVVTESMAELFVRQGHAGDALRIYRELAGRRPGDARLVARIAELESLEAASRTPSTPYAARVTGGVSVRDLMRSILAARPNGRAPATPSTVPADAARATEPTRPAQDAISLSDVFGEEGSTLPPAYRAPRTPASDKGVSFDEFFGTPSEPHTSTVRPRGPRPPADDLDQFHAWLQNLKR